MIGLEGAGQLRQRETLPLLLKFIFLVDLVVCLIRVPVFLLTQGAQVVGMLQGDWHSPAWLVAMLSGAGIIVVGGSGDLMLLSGRPRALLLAYVAVVCTVISIAAGAWIGFSVREQFGVPGTALNGHIAVLVIFTTAGRLGILVVYIKALWGYSEWSRDVAE